MIKREAGFLGLAKQNAKRKGMVKVPKRYQPEGGGPEEYPAFLNQEEMALLIQHGGSGQMTSFGIPSFDRNVQGAEKETDETRRESDRMSGDISSRTFQQVNQDSGGGGDQRPRTGRPAPPKPKKKKYSFDYDKSLSPWDNIKRIDVMGWLKSLPDAKRPKDIRFETDPAKIQEYLRNNPKEAQDAIKQQGGPGAVTASNSAEAKKTAAYAADRAEDYENKKNLKREREASTIGRMKDASGKFEGEEGYDASTAKRDTTDSYEAYKQEAKGLGAGAKKLTEGVMTDATGKVEGQAGYDATTATMQGGFAGDVTKLEKYEDKFGDIAAGAKARGDTAQAQYGGVMTDASGKKVGETGYDESTASIKGGAAGLGATALEGLGKGVMTDASGKTEGQAGYDASSATMQGGYKQVTGQASVDAAAEGRTGFREGAKDVGDVKGQFGKEGFQKDVRGMSEKALSGDVGQREAGMLKGRMEEQRMASQKGSEEKLRRELAQSGASPSEIAQKVAQFQRQSASQQQQAGRSEALSSQLQGQKMGQSALAQAAGLKGQEAGMAGKQAGLAVQQAALKGQGAAMAMQGAQAQTSAQLASLQGQGAMAQAGAGMRMEGVKGGAELGMAGAAQQGTMLGQGMGAVQAAGGAREQQMGGLKDQGGFIDQQGNYVQAQLQDVVAQETQAYSEEQARLTRKAQGTPDDPRYRPPATTTTTETPATTETPVVPGTTTAPQAPGTTAPAQVQGAPAMPPPADAVQAPAQTASAPASPGGINAAPALQGAPKPQGVNKGYDIPVNTMKHPGGIQQANQGRMMAETDMAQANNSAQGVQGVKANLNAQRQNMNPQQLQESQVWEKNFDAYQQAQGGQGGGGMAQMAQGQQASKGMMGAQTPMGQQGGMMAGQLGMAQAGMAQAQGNNQKGMMQNEQSRAELTKQMGQAGAVRGSWKDAQGGGAGGGVAGMVGGFGHGDSPYGQGGLAGIAQQGGLMGQNAGAPGGGMAAAQQALMGQGQLTPEQQEAQRKKAQALGVV